jgi:hypothetical protein
LGDLADGVSVEGMRNDSDSERIERAVALVEGLCLIERESASEGERQAADLTAEALRAAGLEADIEIEQVRGRGFWWPVGLLSGVSVLAGLATLRGKRVAGALASAAATAAMVDDLGGGAHLFRRAVIPKRMSWNVVARVGKQSAPRKVVMLAHHDAPHSGVVFHPRPQQWVWERWPHVIDRSNRSLPVWGPVLAGPFLNFVGALFGRRWLSRIGTALSAGSVAAMVDIGKSPVVPGANDNASGVGALLLAAESLAANPPTDLDVWLVSCGSEESMQSGIRAFFDRHGAELPVGSTWFVNLETVGSPELVMLEGEGTIWMNDYQPGFLNDVERVAAAEGIALRRGLRAGSSTDSVTAHRHGHPVATLTSLTQWKSLSHYHWPTDTPSELQWLTIEASAELAVAVARSLDSA